MGKEKNRATWEAFEGIDDIVSPKSSCKSETLWMINKMEDPGFTENFETIRYLLNFFFIKLSSKKNINLYLRRKKIIEDWF